MTLGRRLAEFAAGLTFEQLPVEVVTSVALRTLDTLGIALAASTAEFGPALHGVLDGWGAAGRCTVIGSPTTATPPLATLANGTLAHGLDFDDTHAASITHASAVVLPTVLALGESEKRNGRTIVTAAVVGYEAITRLGMAAPGAFHARGWHATAVCGAFAAALAAGRTDELDADRLTAALGIAGSFASGVLAFLDDGSWVKRVHPGWAGQSGATAAALARGGWSGPETILEGRFGFYPTFLGCSPDPRPFDSLGRSWETLRIGFKPYPCCHYNHAYIDCALSLRRVHGLSAELVDSIECIVPAGEVPIICEPRDVKSRPRTSYDAQFSLPYSVAAAFADGAVTLDSYAAERLGDKRVLALADRVTYTIDEESPFPDGFPGWLRVRLTDSRVVEAREPDGRGSPARPLPSRAIIEKFRDNAGRALPAARVEEVEHAALEIASLQDVGELMRLCRA